MLPCNRSPHTHKTRKPHTMATPTTRIPSLALSTNSTTPTVLLLKNGLDGWRLHCRCSSMKGKKSCFIVLGRFVMVTTMTQQCKSIKMRADMTDADMAAFYIAAVMMVVMTITLLLLLTAVFRSTNPAQSSTGGQTKVYKTRPAFMPIFTIFNTSLFGMVLGSSVLFSSLLLSLPQSHTYYSVRGGVSLESVGGTLFESSYCIYTWYRSKSLIGESGNVLYWIVTVFAVLNPIIFMAQLVTAVLFENQLTDLQLYREVAVAAAAGMFVLDVGLLACFVNFLLKNPAPTASTGHFNGNSEAQKQWNRTSIIAKYGAFSCAVSFLALAIIAVNALFLSLNEHVNLVTACGYSAAGLGAIILLVMKIKLEGGYWKLVFGSTVKSEEFGKTNDEES